jgi:hypothetical protein
MPPAGAYAAIPANSRMAKQAIESKKIIKVGREYFLAEGAKNDPYA